MRTATIISGVSHFGYSLRTDETTMRALAAGDFYTEPAGVAHFAMTQAEPVVVDITGFGPASTTLVGQTTDAGPK